VGKASRAFQRGTGAFGIAVQVGTGLVRLQRSGRCGGWTIRAWIRGRGPGEVKKFHSAEDPQVLDTFLDSF
jgi:hypothetical protein